MSRIAEKIAQLQAASDDIRRILKEGPLTTGRLLQTLGYSGFNFLITQAIGDRGGEWDDSPHQLALSDLVEGGEVQWWCDEVGDNWYGLVEKTPDS